MKTPATTVKEVLEQVPDLRVLGYAQWTKAWEKASIRDVVNSIGGMLAEPAQVERRHKQK